MSWCNATGLLSKRACRALIPFSNALWWIMMECSSIWSQPQFFFSPESSVIPVVPSSGYDQGCTRGSSPLAKSCLCIHTHTHTPQQPKPPTPVYIVTSLHYFRRLFLAYIINSHVKYLYCIPRPRKTFRFLYSPKRSLTIDPNKKLHVLEGSNTLVQLKVCIIRPLKNIWIGSLSLLFNQN